MLYKYVCDRGFVVWKVIHKTAVTFGSFLRNVQIFYMEYLQQRTRSFLHVNKTMWLNPVSSDGHIFSWTKENTPSLWLVFHAQVLQEMLDPAFCAKWITMKAFM